MPLKMYRLVDCRFRVRLPSETSKEGTDQIVATIKSLFSHSQIDFVEASIVNTRTSWVPATEQEEAPAADSPSALLDWLNRTRSHGDTLLTAQEQNELAAEWKHENGPTKN